jgi:hypothetical protein
MAKSVISKFVLVAIAFALIGCGKAPDPAKDAAATTKEADLQKTSGEN